MRWLKRDMWKVGFALAGLLLLLVLMVWVPVSANAYKGTPRVAIAGSVQAMPTVDVTATMTALNEEKLRQEIQQLKSQNEPTLFDWLRGNISILLLGLGALAGFLRWLADRRDTQDKELRSQAEERFKTAVTALGDEKDSVQIGGAILLRSFLNKEDKNIYGRYYTQIFDLAVANLCPTKTSNPTESPNTPLILTTLRQALIAAFKEVFPLARSQKKGSPQSLDASYIQLDNGYLSGAELKQVWAPRASLRGADLSGADLSGANLRGADLREANLIGADLSGADLSGADLSQSKLGANFTGAFLDGADMSGGNPQWANSLEKSNMARVIGLTKEQLETCKVRGALYIDMDLASASQPTVTPPAPSRSTDLQTSSPPPAQVNTSPSTDGSSTTPSQQDSAS